MTRASVRSLVLLLLVLAPAVPLAAGQTPGPRPMHGPILVEGDSDLCNVEDLDSGQDVADGVVNCATADGSATNPYRIEGWTIQVQPAANCQITSDPALCTGLPAPCSLTAVPAAVAVCGTRKHLVIEDLELTNGEAFRSFGGAAVPAAVLAIVNSDNVRVSDVGLLAAGMGLFVDPGKPVPNLAPVRGVLALERMSIRPTSEPPLSPGYSVSTSAVSLVHVNATNATIDGAHLDAEGRRAVGIYATGSAAHHVTLRDSIVANATGADAARLFATWFQGVQGTIEGNLFYLNGLNAPAPVGVGQAESQNTFGTTVPALQLDDGVFRVSGNRFVLQGAGVSVSNAVAEIRGNLFQATEASSDIAVFQFQEPCRSTSAHYNTLTGVRVINQAEGCSVDARLNWWGASAGPNNAPAAPQAEGAISVQPALQLAVGDLPQVSVSRPQAGDEVHGKFFLEGTAAALAGLEIQRVEASRDEIEFTDPAIGEGTTRFFVPWDATNADLGPLTVWVRACATGNVCGIPTTVDLQVVETPLAPIAVLYATPRIAKVSEPIQLDATLSYSPQDRPITSFRFAVDGVFTDWSSVPSKTVSFDQSGDYPVSLEVRDTSGLVNENLVQLVLRVSGPAAHDEPNGTPAPAIVGVLMVIGGVVFALRRNTTWR